MNRPSALNTCRDPAADPLTETGLPITVFSSADTSICHRGLATAPAADFTEAGSKLAGKAKAIHAPKPIDPA